MPVVIEDPRLQPIREKVEARERLSSEDGLTLFRSTDILSVGYLANLVRERMHGDTTYFNVNRHINPTDVCVASCRLCAFGKQVRDPKAYTMSLDEVWHRAGEGWSEAVTEFHIVGGLHPELTLDWYCEMLRGLKQRFPGRWSGPRTRSPSWFKRFLAKAQREPLRAQQDVFLCDLCALARTMGCPFFGDSRYT